MPEEASEVILKLVVVGLEGLADFGKVFLVVNLSEWKMYSGVFSIVPPVLGGLDVYGGGVEVFDEFFCSVGEGGGGIGSSDEIQFAVGIGVFEDGESVFEGIEPVTDSVGDIAVKVGLPDPSVDD